MAADDLKPRANRITSGPATVQSCKADRVAAQGSGSANNQLAGARTQGNSQGSTR